jgi:hypothetical protein
VVVRDGFEGGGGVRRLFARPARLAAQGDVAGDAVEEGAETAVARRVEAVEGAMRAESFDEDVLYGVVEVLQQGRAAPARGEVGT